MVEPLRRLSQLFTAAKKSPKSSTSDIALEVIKRSPSTSSVSSTSSEELREQALESVKGVLPIKQGSFGLEALDIKLNPGKVQNRAYLLVTEPLFDAWLTPQEKTLPLHEKAGIAMLRLEEKPALYPIYHDLKLMFEPGADIYALRERFYEKLSDAYNSALYRNDADFRKEIQNLGRTIFTAVSLQTYGEDVTRLVMKEGGRKEVDWLKPLSQILEEDRQAIEKAPEKLTGGLMWAAKEKLRGHLNIDFLPTHRNNPTHSLFKASYSTGGKTFETECLRFGSPTIERAKGTPVEISPAFLSFLDSLKGAKEQLLSFQHQNPDPDASDAAGFGGKESQRLEAMVRLQDAYPDTLIVVALPMDGNFFKGKIEFKTADEFVAAFKEIMKDPKHVQLPVGHEGAINEIIHDVHRIYFGETDRPFSPEERQIFQMIAYAHIEKYFISDFKPAYYHSQCKDAMDRAMSLNIISYYIDQLQVGKENDREVLENIRTLTHTAPLLIKGIGMHGKRFKLMQSILDFLQKLSPEQKLMLQKETPSHLYFKGINFDRKLNQTFLPPPASATNEVHYQERMNKEGEHHLSFEGIRDAKQAEELCTKMIKERYNCAKAGAHVETFQKVGVQRKGSEEITVLRYPTDKGYTITANLQLSKTGYLQIDWTVKRSPPQEHAF